MKIKWLISTASLLPSISIPLISLSSCKPNQDTKVTSIALDSVQGIKLNSGESFKATVNVYPSNAKDKSVTYYSSNPSIASIDEEGNISALAKGNTTIYAKANDGSNVISNKIDITVYDQLPVDETPEQYIYNRTFAIAGLYTDTTEHKIKGVLGTCWIVGDSTPDVADDYNYYIATNWHVAQGIKDIESKYEFTYKYGVDNKSSGLTISDDYTTFKATPVKFEDSSFYYDGVTKAKCYESGSWHEALAGIDLFMYNVHFFDKNDTLNSVQTLAKDKLDKLNKYTEANMPITQLASSISKQAHYENKDLYVAGFPALSTNSNRQTWKYHSLKDEGIDLSFTEPTDYTNHSCVDSGEINLVDASCQYMYPTSKPALPFDWLPGGSSGSMLIGNFGSETNPFYKVCAIYWGGFGSQAQNIFWPCFSIFNSYIKDYIKI